MANIPTSKTLADLASSATRMLFNVPVDFGGDCPPNLPDVADGFTVIVPLIGEPLYIVTAKANGKGGIALASIMFGVPANETESSMIEDSLRELTNILAGQVKSLIAQEHQIGLPSRLTDDATLAGASHWAGARLRIGSDVAEVDIAIAEYAVPEFQ
jgi:hypothetical protein